MPSSRANRRCVRWSRRSGTCSRATPSCAARASIQACVDGRCSGAVLPGTFASSQLFALAPRSGEREGRGVRSLLDARPTVVIDQLENLLRAHVANPFFVLALSPATPAAEVERQAQR